MNGDACNLCGDTEREVYAKEKKERVRFRKNYWQRKHPVGGIDLEVLLTKIAKRLLRKNQDPFGGSATTFNHEFSAEKKWHLYQILGKLDDPMRQK